MTYPLSAFPADSPGESALYAADSKKRLRPRESRSFCYQQDKRHRPTAIATTVAHWSHGKKATTQKVSNNNFLKCVEDPFLTASPPLSPPGIKLASP
jgi:hypothetical protein